MFGQFIPVGNGFTHQKPKVYHLAHVNVANWNGHVGTPWEPSRCILGWPELPHIFYSEPEPEEIDGSNNNEIWQFLQDLVVMEQDLRQHLEQCEDDSVNDP